MGISAPRLRLSRHGTYCFRYLVPPQFVEKFGKKELRRSLGTKNSQIAKIIALHLNALIEKALKDLKPDVAMDEIKKLLAAGVHSFTIKTKSKEISTNGTKEDAESLVASLQDPKFREWIDSDIAEGEKVTVTAIDPADQSISSLFRDPVAKPMSIESAISKYMNRKSSVEATKRAKGKPISADKKTTIVAFERFIEEGRLEDITLDSFVHELKAVDFENFLAYYATRKPQKVKKDNSKKSRNGSDAKNASIYDGKGLIENKMLSAATLEKQATNIKDFVGFCRKLELIPPSSALLHHEFREDLTRYILELTSRNRKAGSYEAYNHDELQRLFEPAVLFWCAGGKVDYLWAPLLALHMGFRAKEIATLKLMSIRRIEELHAIQIFEDHSKNENSARIVPIPQKLIDLGFIEYVEFLHEQVKHLPDEERKNFPLFPHVNVKSNTFATDPGKNISRFFSIYRGLSYFELNLNFKVFHSFRHTVVSVLDALQVDRKVQEAIVGHAQGDDGVVLRSEYWSSRKDGMAHETNKRYTKPVEGFKTLSTIQHNKQHLDDVCDLYELDYKGLRLATKAAQDLLRCDVDGKTWRSGFRTNQKAIIAKLPKELSQFDTAKVKEFSWHICP
jgi:hypothetical protein